MKIYNSFLLSLFIFSKAFVISAKSNAVIGFTRYDHRFLLSEDSPNTNGNDGNNGNTNSSVFDIKSISSMLTKDITHPKLMNNSTDIGFYVNKECSDFINSKYACINLQNKDFKSYCKKLETPECNTIGEGETGDITRSCNINVSEATELILTINQMINGKQYFCLKKDIKLYNNKDRSTKTDNSNGNENKNDDKSNSESEFCPLTVALQKGYLDLVKEGEEQEINMNKRKRKRSPLISDVNSFIPSRSVDLQVIKNKLVEDLRENCNYSYCNEKAKKFIEDIREDYSYFGVIYKYKVNDDTLKNSILNLLNRKNCYGTISGIIPKYEITSQILITIAISLLLLLKMY